MRRHKNTLFNFIVNTYGLTKEVILEAVKERVDDVLSKHVKSKLDSKEIESIIRNYVAKYIKDGSVDRYFYDRHTFSELVKQCLREAVKEEVAKNYKVVVKEVNEGKK